MVSCPANGDLPGTDTKVSDSEYLIEITVDRALYKKIPDNRCVTQIRTIGSIVVFDLPARVVVILKIGLDRLQGSSDQRGRRQPAELDVSIPQQIVLPGRLNNIHDV